MDDGSGDVVIFKSGFHETERQVDVFAVHEKVFVESVDFSEQIGFDKGECSGKDVDVVRFVGRQVAEMVFREKFRIRENLRQAEYFAERHPRSRE